MKDKRKIAHNVVEHIKFTGVFCIVCHERFTPVEGGDPICPDCFNDFAQANQPTIISPVPGERENINAFATIISRLQRERKKPIISPAIIISHGLTPMATIISPVQGESKSVKS